MPKPTIVIEGNDRDGYTGRCEAAPSLAVRGPNVNFCENEMRRLLRKISVEASPLVRVETTTG